MSRTMIMLAMALATGIGVSFYLSLTADAGAFRPSWNGPEHIWRSSCGYCHGGASGAPELRGAGLPPEAIAQFVRQGAPGMPVFHASEISDGELKQLTEWISAQRKPKPQRRQ